jgi:two-component system sensor histidine kinase/response regulator
MMDGVTATEIIRNYYDAEKVPIIALTAYSEVYHKKALKAGCNEVIKKPIELDNIAPILMHYLH